MPAKASFRTQKAGGHRRRVRLLRKAHVEEARSTEAHISLCPVSYPVTRRDVEVTKKERKKERKQNK